MKRLTIGLIGNPNSGKTTLFNALTGTHQRIGNWPGVTVERKTGHFHGKNHLVGVVDLPGIYSLSVLPGTGAMDERIAADYMISTPPDLIVNVVDASNLERNLYLTTQLLELNIPIVIALNMADIAKRRGIQINIDELSNQLGCPIIPLVSSKKRGIQTLKQTIINHCGLSPKNAKPIHYPEKIQQALTQLCSTLSENRFPYFLAVRLLEDDLLAQDKVSSKIIAQAKQLQKEISNQLKEDADIFIADARYQFIQQLIKKVISETNTLKKSVTAIIDNIVLNRVLGIPIFLAVIYVMFLFAISVGGAFQDFFDISSNALFVHGLAQLLISWHFPAWLTAIITAGIGKGINTTLTFIPVIGAMFLFLSFLENSGYMARAAFVIDRLMYAIGLPGKSFVPMIVGFGCNVPAIMGARILENQRDRILTIMMSPFMSCGARLAIYAIFTAAFFPHSGQNIVFILYLTGIAIAIFTGLILRKTLLTGDRSPLVLELPPYHIPLPFNLLSQAWYRLKSFIVKAGKVIIPVCLILGTLNTVNTNFKVIKNNHYQHSILATAGKSITPIFQPMGIQQDNWPATVGLVTGTLAKEVVVATLNTLYAEASHIHIKQQKFSVNIKQGLYEAWLSIPHNLAKLGGKLTNPLVSNTHFTKLNRGIYGQMYKRFGGKINAFAYLLFVLLYIPCLATIATILKELNWRWTLFSICWNTGIAYGISVFFYQAATLLEHPFSSMLWLGIIIFLFFATVFIMQQISVKKWRSHHDTT